MGTYFHAIGHFAINFYERTHVFRIAPHFANLRNSVNLYCEWMRKIWLRKSHKSVQTILLSYFNFVSMDYLQLLKHVLNFIEYEFGVWIILPNKGMLNKRSCETSQNAQFARYSKVDVSIFEITKKWKIIYNPWKFPQILHVCTPLWRHDGNVRPENDALHFVRSPSPLQGPPLRPTHLVSHDLAGCSPPPRRAPRLPGHGCKWTDDHPN